jgi:hypothetical protein
VSSSMRALPVGRILRFCLGAVLVVAVWPFFRTAESNRILGATLVVVGLTVFYAVVHWLVSSYLPKLNRWLGAFLAVLPVLLVFVFGRVLGQVGAASFLAVSLLLAAIRADAGCEVMSIPSLVFGKRTHLMCLLFSPLDWVEEKIVAALRPSTASRARP